MMFRIWFLYVCKLVLALVAAQLLLNFVPPQPWVLTAAIALTWILGTCAAIGALLAVPVLFLRCRLRCPLCGEPGELVVRTRLQPGVLCSRCGLVYAQNYLTSFKLGIDPDADFGTENSPPEKSGPPGN